MTRYSTLSAFSWSLGVCLFVVFAEMDLRAEDELTSVEQADEGDNHQPKRLDVSAVASDTDDDKTTDGKEIIRERFPNGAVRIEREVAQDAEDNYLNHGNWQMWDAHGNRVAKGQYRNGKRHGSWTSWRLDDKSSLLSDTPLTDFTAPLISQANFQDGNLHGDWIIYDAKQRKICQFSFENGKRDGQWTWWYPTGRKQREATYENGDVEGEVFQWNTASQLVAKSTYTEGRRLAKKVVYHHETDRQKKTEGTYLFAKRVPQSSDDWWYARLATKKPVGKDEKHGNWTSWYPNGQEQMRGNYHYDIETGKFTWWHSNGQKSADGTFEAGKQHSTWTWWHPNGQKSVQGQFSYGEKTGHWNYWNSAGKITQRADFSAGSVSVAKRLTAAETASDSTSESETTDELPE